MVPPDSEGTALLLVPAGCVVVNRTLVTEEADGIRYPDHSMTREYNAFYSEQHCA